MVGDHWLVTALGLIQLTVHAGWVVAAPKAHKWMEGHRVEGVLARLRTSRFPEATMAVL